ncbi:hypothetical protein J422_06957 [Methanocaldococcus villosus KIN24-T80]|uniref:Transcription regulator TrmB C-terminal domain-containing protein n=1 Tax=Methanocaldococcus villosus KIN24-T80 TaxID=1069083 RepID=N6VR53_9EURY|nr:TrmB family transcriptional regulator sugar-binding domain-containing protein [Methanocaldococcus villosus]ENN95606.1 hypothetical protein J422_06957 [Methanocaldococcus villosus KIN24-T80]
MKRILELLVVLAIIITATAVAYKFINNNKDYEFSGDEMYKCTWIADKILNKGFPLKAHIYGYWVYDKKLFNDTVEVYYARGGILYAIYNNDTVTIGGRLAYKEDIAAEKIELIPIGKYIVVIDINPLEGKDFRDIYERVLKNISFNYIKAYIVGKIAADTETFKPTERIKLDNILFVDEIKGLDVFYIENGLILSGKINLDKLKELDNYIKVNKTSTSKLKLYIVTNDKVSGYKVISLS